MFLWKTGAGVHSEDKAEFVLSHPFAQARANGWGTGGGLVHRYGEGKRGNGGRDVGRCRGRHGVGVCSGGGAWIGLAAAAAAVGGASATACQGADCDHGDEDGEHCAPATTAGGNAEEGEQGKDCAGARSKQFATARAFVTSRQLGTRQGRNSFVGSDGEGDGATAATVGEVDLAGVAGRAGGAVAAGCRGGRLGATEGCDAGVTSHRFARDGDGCRAARSHAG